MAFGFGALRLSPRDFWAMSPRELAAAAGFAQGDLAPPLTRADLDALLARHCD
jgi:uncharacterized phage protein (TIGR02216 family)